MSKFEVIVKNVPNNDDNIIFQLHKYTNQSVDNIKECIFNGLPICSWELSYHDLCKVYKICTEIFQKNNLDVIIKYDNKIFSLKKFVQFRKSIRFYVNYVINRICNLTLRIRIGKFNGLPLYFYLLEGGKRIYEYAFHDRIYYNIDSLIGISFAFLLLPKYLRNIILWHEYGHHILNINPIDYGDEKSYKLFEAIADFYACCKCKLHFNSWSEMRLNKYEKIKFKLNNENQCNYFEKRYNNIRESDMEIADYVYQFYRDNGKLFLCYKELFNKYGYNKKFNWNNLLNEIGWSKNKDRWEHINYNNQN
jgi:hypothetical protein